MRLVVLSLLSLVSCVYVLAAFHVYREELGARDIAPLPPQLDQPSSSPPLHPEANMLRLRNAFAAEEYTDDLRPYLERALAQAPTFYQPPFLLAAFHANRLERPETIESSFEAAIGRFPSNGRLHLTFAEWLLTPKTSAPYRAYRTEDDANDDALRSRALEHIERATSLEVDLARRALEVLVRFRIPVNRWTGLLPDDDTTRQLILEAADRLPRDRDARRQLITTYLAGANSAVSLRAVASFARRWEEPQIALEASETWYQLAFEGQDGAELTRATLSLARERLDQDRAEGAYNLVRSTLTAMDERGLAEDSATLLVGMGNVYLARGRVVMAQSLFTEAASLFPFHAPAYLGLAHAHERAGDRESAIRELRRVLELEPDNNQARSLLDVMLTRP